MIRRPAAVRDAGLLMVALLASGCHHPPPRPALDPVLDEIQVRVTRIVPAELPRPSGVELTALARSAAAAVPGRLKVVVAVEPGRPHLRLTVEVELAFVPGRTGTLRAVVHARLEPRGEPTGGAMRVDREILLEKEDLVQAPDAAVVEAHLRRAFELSVGGAVRAEQLWLGPPAAARDAIGAKDTELRDEAIRIAGERRDRATVPCLLPMLKTEEQALRDGVVGALAEIGDERAVKPLAELAKFGDLDELPKILDALSRIGGAEALSYLEFVSGGHPSPEIRDLAKRALEHAHARLAK